MKTVQRQLCDSVQDIESCGAMSSAELRKINKPIVEKKRRERINACLDELKDLLLQQTSSSVPSTTNKQNENNNNNSKLEKADILEMTVRHLRSMQRRQLPSYPTSNTIGLPHSTTVPDTPGARSSTTSYRDGYSDCAREVATYLGRLESVGLVARTRVLSHLSSRLRSVNGSLTSSRPAIAASSSIAPALRLLPGCGASMTPSSSSVSPPNSSFPVFESSRRQDRVATTLVKRLHHQHDDAWTKANTWSASTRHYHRSTSAFVDRTNDDVIVGKSTTVGRDYDEAATRVSGMSGGCDAIVGSSGVKQEMPSSSSSGYDVNGNNIVFDDYSSANDASHLGDDVWRPW